MMINLNVAPSKRFKFKQRLAAGIAFASAASVFVYLDAIAIIRHQFSLAYFFFFWASLWWWSTGVVSVSMQKSDVLVDINGIKRFLFKHVWQSIAWQDVTLVRIFTLYPNRAAGYKNHGIHIMLPKASIFRFIPAKKIVLSDSVDDFTALIDILNYYILEYQIKVEIKVNGEWQSREKIFFS